MENILYFFDLLLHLDKHLGNIIQTLGGWIYLLLFLIIFCETGLVITPVLPGDSLLFALGTFAAIGNLQLELIIILLTWAAILGDTVNYSIGKLLGPYIFSFKGKIPLNKKHLLKTQEFYARHGGKTIFLARFIPIIRTFAPFVAGIGTMNYLKFLSYNITGAISWVMIFTGGGYYFGNIPLVKQNFSLVILAIIFLSCLPGIIEYIRQRKETLQEVK